MKKALSYRLFGLGRIPARLRPLIEAEGVVVADEGMPGRFVADRVDGPGRRYRGRTAGFSGFLVITGKRVLAYSYGKRQVSIGVDDPRFRELFVRLPDPATLAISFESSVFRDDWAGVIEFRFGTDKAPRFHDALIAIGASQGRAGDR